MWKEVEKKSVDADRQRSLRGKQVHMSAVGSRYGLFQVPNDRARDPEDLHLDMGRIPRPASRHNLVEGWR